MTQTARAAFLQKAHAESSQADHAAAYLAQHWNLIYCGDNQNPFLADYIAAKLTSLQPLLARELRLFPSSTASLTAP